MAKQWKNEDIISPEDAQRWENGIENAQQNNTQNETNLKNHTDNKLNPHNVTAAQTGAYTKAEADAKDSSVLTTAKGYTDSHTVKKDNPHGVTATQVGAYSKADVDEKDASTLKDAKSYSDTKKNEANAYTDQKVATAKTEIQSSSVASANKLTTARKIAGIDFDGSKDISIAANNVGAYTKAETDSKVTIAKSEIISGNVASATKLKTPRSINGVSFDGTADIEVVADPNQRDIAANTDLNNLTIPAFWSSVSDGNTSTLTNTPFGNGTFSLQVETGLNNTRIYQTAKRMSNGDIAVRSKTESASWSSWTGIAKNNNTQQTGLIAEKATSLNSARNISLSGGATGTAVFDGSKDISISATLAGNAPTASKLATPRTISLSGAVTGSANFDGSSNLSIATKSEIAIAKFSLSDVITTSKSSFSDAFWQYRRQGDRVDFFARLNFSSGATTTNMIDIHSIPVGFRLSSEFSDTMWNVPLSVSVVGNPSNHEMNGVAERQATNLIRVGSSTSGNKYVYGTWFTDDPFPAG
ncbi:pyocin knob domain-containing protein [Enterococcus casseliflavus]